MAGKKKRKPPHRHQDRYADQRDGAGDRGHYRADGAPKRPYLTQSAAEKVVASMRAKGDNVHAYPCDVPSCGQWHIGHLKGYAPRHGTQPPRQPRSPRSRRRR